VKKILKWLLVTFGSIVGIALIGAGVVYVLIGNDLARTFEYAGTSLALPDDQVALEEGERLARLRGCMGGCHGATVNGGVFFEAPDGTRVVAPDLGVVAQNYSVADLEGVIRHGIRPDGTSVIVPMPSSMFYHLSDQDVAAIIAYLKRQTPGEQLQPETSVGPLARLFFFYYRQSLGTILAAELIDHDAPRLPVSTGEPVAHGRYLAMTVCTECHGADLRGGSDDFAPSLALVAAYSLQDFRTLMQTGVPIGDRELDLMARVSRARFSHFTDLEIDSLHAYLQTIAAAAGSQSSSGY